MCRLGDKLRAAELLRAAAQVNIIVSTGGGGVDSTLDAIASHSDMRRGFRFFGYFVGATLNYNMQRNE